MATGLQQLVQPKTLPIQSPMGPAEPLRSERELSNIESIRAQLGMERPKQAEFEATQAQFGAEQEKAKAAGRAKATEAERQAIEAAPAYTEAQEVERDVMNARFEPTQRSAQENMALMTAMNILGYFIGAGGKNSAQQAMSAFNGMLEGKNAGDIERFKQEKIKFDTNLKALKDRYSVLTGQLKRVADLAARDKEKALQELDVVLAENQADFIKQNINKFGIAATIKNLEDAEKGAVRLYEKALGEEARARQDAQRAADQRQRDREQRQFLAAMQTRREEAARSLQSERLAAAATKAATAVGAEKPPPKEIVAQNQLRNTLIPKIEEALPVLKRINDEGNWNKMTALLAIDPRAAEYSFRDDPEALNLILTLAYFRSKEFETAGKALTKKEDQILAPIVRGDLRVYEGIQNAMSQGLKSLKSEQQGLERVYPYLAKYNQAFRSEAGIEPSGGAETYSMGQIIVKGNKKYRVIGVANPNDPDVEEVKE